MWLRYDLIPFVIRFRRHLALAVRAGCCPPPIAEVHTFRPIENPFRP